MSARNDNCARLGEDDSLPMQPGQSPWETAWLNNKGAILIVLAELIGSSMDATVRYLQQGENGMHPFQVCNDSKQQSSNPPLHQNPEMLPRTLAEYRADNLCTHESDVSVE